jgi:hypothetical protein
MMFFQSPTHPTAKNAHSFTLRPLMDRAINSLLIAFSLASLALGEGAAHAGVPEEFRILSQMPPELLTQCQASADEDGLVGSNRNGLFIADEERQAMDGLVVGLVLEHDS